MRKWIPRVLGAVVGLLVLALGGIYLASSARMSRTWDVPVASIRLADDSVTLSRGEHIARTRGCLDCHGEDLTGRSVIDVPILGTVTATNLTPGENGVGASYAQEDWVRAIRSGVRPDGSGLLVMPSYEYRLLGPDDLGALVSWLRTVPPRASEPVVQRVGPLGRALYLFAGLPLVPAESIDHASDDFSQPVAAATAEYGAYMAAGCVGCHQSDYSGGPFAGLPPESPEPANLTPDPETGLGDWTEEQFHAFLTTGVKPDGSSADPAYMPWPATAAMTELERGAIWAFLRSLPPVRSEQ